MVLFIVLRLALGALDPTPDAPIPPPYAPPADQIAGDVSRDDTPVVADPEPEVADDARLSPPPSTPRAYLYATYPGLARKLDCMIQKESSWDPSARSGPYVGLAQFDYPTWMETPEGQAGSTRTDPYASIDAMAWGTQHLGWSRWPRSSRLC